MRDITKRAVLFFLLIAVPLFSIWLFSDKRLEFSGITMGTSYTIKCDVPKWVSKQTIDHHVTAEFQRLNALFSNWDPESVVSQFNASPVLQSVDISPDFVFVLEQAFELYKDSLGVFDPTIGPLLELWGFGSSLSFFNVPPADILLRVQAQVGMKHLNLKDAAISKQVPGLELNLSALAKGYAVDCVAEQLVKLGASAYLIEVGGEIRVKSKRTTPWKLGVKRPSYQQASQDLFATVYLQNGALATSGDYQHYFVSNDTVYAHILDPLVGKPVEHDVAAVSVIAPTCMLADGLATTLFALGTSRALSLIEAYPTAECMIVVRLDNGSFKTVFSSGMAALLLE